MALITKSLVANGSKGHHRFTLNVNENSTDISNNTSSLSFSFVLSSLGGAYDWYGWRQQISYSININGKVYSGYIPDYNGTSTITLNSGSLTVEHNSDGKKDINISFSVSDTTGQSYTSGNASSSGTMTLTTIPRASKANEFYTDNNDIEKGMAVYYTSYYSGFTNKLRISVPQVQILETIDNYENEKWFELSDASINYLYGYMASSNTVQLGAVIETWNGNTKIGESAELVKTFYIRNANPTLGSTSYKDSNSTTTAITGNNQRIIRNNSNLVFTFGNASSQKGASISKYQVTFAGITKERTSAGDIDFGKVNLSSNTTATLKVFDSRGNFDTKEINVVIDNWELPSALIDIKRKNNFYSETDIKADASYSSLNSKNTITITCQYKKVSDSNYTSISLQDNVQTKLDLDNNHQWNITIIVKDKIGTTTYNLMLDRGMPIIFFDRLLSSVGINCFPTKEKSIEVDGEANAKNIAFGGSQEVDSLGRINTGEELNKSGLYSVHENNNWYNLINIRHRNGLEDGIYYGMQIRNFMTTNNQKLQFRQQVNSNWGEWRNIQEEPTVLYDGVDAGGTLETVTLSESASNFSYIEIFATKDEDSGIWSVKTPSPNGRTVQVGTQYYVQNHATIGLQMIGKTVKIQDNKITHNTEFYMNFNKSTGSITNLGGQNTVKILKVIGYR